MRKLQMIGTIQEGRREIPKIVEEVYHLGCDHLCDTHLEKRLKCYSFCCGNFFILLVTAMFIGWIVYLIMYFQEQN